MSVAIDRTEMATKYGNKWVALTDDKQVICSGNDLDEVLEGAKKKGVDDPITARIPDPNNEYIF